MLTKATGRRTRIEGDQADLSAALEQAARRLKALRAERQAAMEELARLADETSSLTAQVEQVLENREAQEARVSLEE
jgi:hypothetical protein